MPSSHLWHHVWHELLSPKTRLDGHHQNHVHERDKGNHLLHWRPWLDANTNLGKGGKGRGGEGRERGGKRQRREGEREGGREGGREGKRGEEGSRRGRKREEKNVRRKICVTK